MLRTLRATVGPHAIDGSFSQPRPMPERVDGIRAIAARSGFSPVPLLLSVLAAVALNGKLAVIEPERASRPDELSRTSPGLPEYLPRSASDRWKDYIAAGGFQRECDLLGATCQEIHQHRTP
jgi:hypothetical protein